MSSYASAERGLLALEISSDAEDSKHVRSTPSANAARPAAATAAVP